MKELHAENPANVRDVSIVIHRVRLPFGDRFRLRARRHRGHEVSFDAFFARQFARGARDRVLTIVIDEIRARAIAGEKRVSSN